MELKQEKELNSARLQERKNAQAEAFLAQKEAREAQAWYHLILNHCGQAGLRNGIFHDCEANRRLIDAWLLSNNLDGSKLEHLEKALEATRPQLAVASPERYERRTNTKEHLFMEQRQKGAVLVPPAAVPYTRDELREMSRNDLEYFKKLMHMGPAYVAEMNRILAS